ncbi:beta-class carbonic anhydrase [Aminipila terrae]|uniref:carbonic anhydrase n=1 Tax=Aminipila terrae TaxID=2697030 RepID=A0A6P1MEN4_9FIRM|nr:carbonic anhydrase [Aminipila terrae]QHI71593.1 carbonic anhydrase [Aminipila terrae]
MINDIVEFNKKFVANKGYEKYITNKYPDKKLAILTCMDTRLLELLPAALGLKNGDAKIIKNAGGVVSHPFGSAVRSLLVAILDLQVEDVMVIGHTDCGAQSMDAQKMIKKLKERNISEEHINLLHYCGVDFDTWLGGFDCVENSVRNTLDILKHHPLIPKDVRIRGFIMDSVTGELTPVECE